MAPQGDDIGRIAKRWLRSKVTELTTTDRHTRDDAAAEADWAAHEAEESAKEEAVLTAFPGLRRMRDQQEAAARQRDLDELEALRALPQAGLGISVEGVVTGTWSGLVRTRIEPAPYERFDEDGEAVDTGDRDLRMELLVLEEEGIPLVGGVPFLGWSFVVPGYRGAGHYDLAAVDDARQGEGGSGLDPIDFAVYLGSEDEAAYWLPESGLGSVEVGQDATALTVRMAASGPGGEVTVVGSVNLPTPLPDPG